MVGEDGHRGWIYYLAVDSSLRGRHVGARILRHAEQWLTQRGVAKSMLMVRPENHGVQRFYEHTGYGHEDRVVMSRWLRKPQVQTDIQLGPVQTAETQTGSKGGEAAPANKLDIEITYLEMRAPPPRSQLPRPTGSVELLRARDPTLSFYRYLYNTVGEPWWWYERRQLDDTRLREIIHDPKVEVYVLYLSGVPAGYAELDRRIDTEVELSYLGLIPAFIGRGLGSYLLDHAIRLAWHSHPQRLWVHTCDLDHPSALGAYQRAGFEIYKKVIESIEDPRTNEGFRMGS
jgi:ribosomal protein S18 acetylase RimI-like enzyme